MQAWLDAGDRRTWWCDQVGQAVRQRQARRRKKWREGNDRTFAEGGVPMLVSSETGAGVREIVAASRSRRWRHPAPKGPPRSGQHRWKSRN